jgi:arabinogalactan endo-1,4-beta-galactosidase
LLSPQDDAGWTLNWNRNAQLFNEAIRAVRDAEATAGKSIKIALHLAAPAETNWLLNGFLNNGVVDFDVIGISYYWAWHKPTTIAQTGQIIRNLKQSHPDREIMIFETGYIWTFQSNDNANNIINDTHPDYHPPSPVQQRRWLEDLTREVVAAGGSGVLYWEPAWVSSPCWTQWGQGSHQEHAAFFDFNNELLQEGGMLWMGEEYIITSTGETNLPEYLSFRQFSDFIDIVLDARFLGADTLQFAAYTIQGSKINMGSLQSLEQTNDGYRFPVSGLIPGTYILVITGPKEVSGSLKFVKI